MVGNRIAYHPQSTCFFSTQFLFICNSSFPQQTFESARLRAKINIHILHSHDPISNVYKFSKCSNFAVQIIYTCEVRRLYPFTGSEYKNTNACYRYLSRLQYACSGRVHTRAVQLYPNGRHVLVLHVVPGTHVTSTST